MYIYNGVLYLFVYHSFFLSLSFPISDCMVQVLDIDTPSPPPYKLCYDAEWLAILRSTEHLMSYSRLLWLPPHPSTDSRCIFVIFREMRERELCSYRLSYTPTSEEVDEVKTLFHGNLVIPENFTSQQHSVFLLTFDPHDFDSAPPLSRQTLVSQRTDRRLSSVPLWGSAIPSLPVR